MSFDRRSELALTDLVSHVQEEQQQALNRLVARLVEIFDSKGIGLSMILGAVAWTCKQNGFLDSANLIEHGRDQIDAYYRAK